MTGKVNIHTSMYITRNKWQDIIEGGCMAAGGDNIWRKGHSCRKIKKSHIFQCVGTRNCREDIMEHRTRDKDS